jgi:hypothetical protein
LALVFAAMVSFTASAQHNHMSFFVTSAGFYCFAAN